MTFLGRDFDFNILPYGIGGNCKWNSMLMKMLDEAIDTRKWFGLHPPTRTQFPYEVGPQIYKTIASQR